jgi:hypothetical protein
MSKGSLAAAAALLALLLASAAAAQSIERVRVAGPGVTSAFPRGISLRLASPPTYARRTASGAQGSWGGPGYWASGKGDLGGKTAIRWSVAFSAGAVTARTAALAAPIHTWPVDKKDPIAIPHYVGKRVVGTILGYYVITRAPAPDDASYEAAVAFPLAPKALAIARFLLADPSTDSAGQWGSYLVNGVDLPSVWNRGQAFWALSGVSLVGNLPPTRVDLSASGRTVRGTVADAFRHPVVGLPVSVQRQVGGSWRQVTKARTNAKGSFVIRVGPKGDYRAVARSRGKVVASRSVRVD